MATDTDIKLRSALDANQRDREQMCRAVLALDRRYSEVRPRHPHGGPDGGRDIEAVLDGDRTAYGAVGFSNSANDSSEQKTKIRSKFNSDLSSALGAHAKLKVFVFLTNLHFTMGEQNEMKAEAKRAGIEHCDVLDRERLRIELDSPAGFFIRFQYLGIPLSPEEQASFLSRYGDKLQDVVATGFNRIETTLNRVLFLQESTDILDGIHVRITLTEQYSAEEIGHFRACWLLTLRSIVHNIFQIIASSSDKSHRFSDDRAEFAQDLPGIGNGIASGQWEQHLKLPSPDLEDEGEDGETISEDAADDPDDEKWTPVGYGSGIGSDPVSDITVSYRHDNDLIRFQPRIQLRDLDRCMFMPILNKALAQKVSSFDVYANGYHLLALGPSDFRIDNSSFNFSLPGEYSPEELSDPWVRIRPASGSSAFHLYFSSRTPRRMFGHEEVAGRSEQAAEPASEEAQGIAASPAS
ncbi:hypothetical protein [Methylobacterium sp. J-092]|uniref:hypothetical protein n=1 Tax=Methylobacterium sp. J-092 TaxID=2836667 RepID=UPI001FB9AA60|nr:hypothetical protein [Methylobacterium sp. J-092]MCJ2010441.1 hypothetical protein [Methylobacterium sp. J-092]